MSWVSPLIVLWTATLLGGNLPEGPRVGQKIDSFKLRDQLGTWRTIDDLKSAKIIVVAFVGVECPLAKLYAVRLGDMEREYRNKGVAFLAIDGNRQDSVTELQQYAKKHNVEFPILKDTDNAVTDQFAAARTPEIFVLDQTRTIRYHGRVDDQYGVGVARRQATEHNLKDAIEDLLAGRQVAKATTETPGCLIGRLRTPDPNSKVTYTKDIAPIFRQRCESCHREGEIGPISLQTYDEVVGWADTIAEVVRDQRMPPWHADPNYGKFRNDCRLSDEQKQIVFDWVAAGAPEGSPSDLPAPAKFTDGWQIPTPDLVVSMKHSVHVPATGVMGYEHIVLDPGITEDKWVVAAEARPGARSVVHHIIVFVKPPSGHEDDKQAELDKLGSKFLVATAPGAKPLIMPPGTAKLIPAGSKLVFQMHYTPNGTAQDDLSSVGLVFADAKTIEKRVKTAFSGTFVISIPPNDPNYSIVAQRSMQYDTLLIDLMPHMHVRGKSFRYTALYPNGTKEIILDVPHYDFNWQNTYELAEPKLLPAGTILEARAVYNNGPDNPTNPDPNRTVPFGEQTWDEMMLGFYDACPADQDLKRGGLGDVSRVEAFLDALGGDGDPISPELRDLARHALINSTDFHKFVLATRLLVPQIDRICVSSVDESNLEVVYAENGSGVNSRYYMPGSKQAAMGFALANYAAGSDHVINDDLTKTKGFDMKLMQREFKSSFHVPIMVNGKKAVISFWSKDKVAFPGLAVDILRMISTEIQSKIADKPTTSEGQAKS